MAIAFSLYPTTMEQLIAVSDAGKVMPPKSTWFEPKLRSGLFVHELASQESGVGGRELEACSDWNLLSGTLESSYVTRRDS